MLTLEEAIQLIQAYLPEGFALCDSYGEAQGKYVFNAHNSKGDIPPGGINWTVDQKTGECKNERLEREFLAPYAPIRGYKKLGEFD